jgi:hypothetical protein
MAGGAMNNRRLIIQSLAKWRGYLEQETIEPGWQDCPLCLVYRNIIFSPNPSIECFGCPVYKFTGETGCEQTPYADLDKNLRKRSGYKLNVRENRFLIEAEIALLERLLNYE